MKDPQIVVVTSVELVVLWLLVARRYSFQPGILRWLLDLDRRCLSCFRTAVPGREGDGQSTTALGSQECKFPGRDPIYNRDVGDAPRVLDVTDALGLQFVQVGKLWNDLDAVSAVPRPRRTQRENRFGDVLSDSNIDVDRLDFSGVNCFELKDKRFVAKHATGIKREGVTIDGYNAFLIVISECPVGLLRPSGLCNHGSALAFRHFNSRQ